VASAIAALDALRLRLTEVEAIEEGPGEWGRLDGGPSNGLFHQRPSPLASRISVSRCSGTVAEASRA
jgi:hypothetical protein